MNQPLTEPRTMIGDSDLSVFPLALGGNVFGWTADETTSFDVLDAFTAGGGNLIDTADSYSAFAPGNSGGESETILGNWFASRGNRSDIVLATKVSQHPEFKGLAPENVRGAVDASLSRLRTDYIDLYYAHFDDLTVPIEQIAAVFSELVDAGKVRAIALSNFEPARIEQWLQAATENNLHKPVALQPHYNLVERDFEQTYLPIAERENLAVLPYFALAKGFLTGKYRDGATVDSPRAGGASVYLDERGRRVLQALDQIAATREASVASVALAWLAAQPTVAAPIASARNLEQLPDLLASARLSLDADELASLGAASA